MRGSTNEYPQSMFCAEIRKYHFSFENCHFYSCKNHSILHRHVIEMDDILINTVNSEMFARTKVSLIFPNSLPREFKVLANIDNT